MNFIQFTPFTQEAVAARRRAVLQGPLVPVRRFDGDLPVAVHHAAGVRDDGHRAEVLVAVDHSSATAADYDPIPARLPQVLDAQESHQSDFQVGARYFVCCVECLTMSIVHFQTIEPANLQRDVVLSVLHVAVRIVGRAVFRGAKESLCFEHHTK